MSGLEELRQLRHEIAPPRPEAWAKARCALATAVTRERGEHRAAREAIPARSLPYVTGPHGRRRSWRSRPAWAAVAVAAVFVAAGAAAAFSTAGTGGHRFAADGRPRTSKPSSGVASSSKARRTIVLAGYRFVLPKGFRPAAAASCATSPTAGDPMTVLGGISAAASAAGGCVTAQLAAGTSVVPSNAKPVEVGSYQGFLVSETSQSEVLYVAIQAAEGDHYLIVSAVGLPADQLITVVAGGLPSSPGTTTPCSEGCG